MDEQKVNSVCACVLYSMLNDSILCSLSSISFRSVNVFFSHYFLFLPFISMFIFHFFHTVWVSHCFEFERINLPTFINEGIRWNNNASIPLEHKIETPSSSVVIVVIMIFKVRQWKQCRRRCCQQTATIQRFLTEMSHTKQRISIVVVSHRV